MAFHAQLVEVVLNELLDVGKWTGKIDSDDGEMRSCELKCVLVRMVKLKRTQASGCHVCPFDSHDKRHCCGAAIQPRRAST